MTKKGCCCKEENPFVKHYVAIKCDEYATKQYKTVGVHTIFDDYPPSNFTTGLGEPHFPFKVTGVDGNGLQIAKDGSRRIKLMLRGAGGGAPRESYGGNGAYIDFNLVPFSTNTMSSMSLYVGRGGPGGIHTDFSTTTINPFGGGGGFPLAGWGGGAVAYGDSVQALQAGGQYVVGSGAGAGAHIDFDTLFGGHGGVDTGIPGDGPSPGNAAIQTQGGAGGAGAGIGFARVGGYGFRFTPSGTIPVQSVGGGGGAGYFGGGGGGPSSSGGGGSSTKFDILSNKPIDQGFYGTGIGPGSRCNPFFERTTKDSGIGANNLGRYLKALGTGYVSYFNGQPGQAAEYHRTRWCPCTESQTSNDATGVFPNGPNYICLTEDQYNLILNQVVDLPDYNELFNAGATDVKLSFVLNGQRYLLTTWNNDIYGDPLDNYYCTLGCEAPYMANGTPTNLKWFVQTTDVFANYSDSRNFFQTLYENSGIDLSTVTTCCDIFIGERICAPPTSNCSNSTDGSGNVYGCICQNQQTPPKYKSICKSSVNVDGPFIAIDQESQYYYLCIPASGWHRFGNGAIIELYNFFNGIEPDNKINLGGNLSYYSAASSLNISDLQQQLCAQDQVFSVCNQAGSNGECGCRNIVAQYYQYPDPEAINAPIVFKHVGGALCAMNNYNTCLRSCSNSAGKCGREDPKKIELDANQFAFRACGGESICNIDGCWSMLDPGCTPTSPQQCGCIDDCGNVVGFTLKAFSYAKKIADRLNPLKSLSNLYKAIGLQLNSKTMEVTTLSSTVGGYLQRGMGPGGGTNPCNGGPAITCDTGSFVGFYAKIQRHSCPPGELIKCLGCESCGCEQGITDAINRCGNTDLIIEDKSYQTLMCVSIYPEPNAYYESVAMTITLQPCLFTGYPNRAARAAELVSLSATSAEREVCSDFKSIPGYRIKVCQQCVDLIGAPISWATSYITACIPSYYAIATTIDDSGWYGTRVMASACDCPQLEKAGDELTLEFLDNGVFVTAVFKFKSQQYSSCVTVQSKPICSELNSSGSEPDDCYSFPLTDARGDIQASFISTNPISYPEWAANSRWGYQPASEGDVCYIQQIGPESCRMYGEAFCTWQAAYPDIPDSDVCCSLMTNCGDNANEYKCSDVQTIQEFCQFCQNYECCGQNCYKDGCSVCCIDPLSGDCNNSQPCPQIHGCVTNPTPNVTDVCITQVGSLFIFN